MTAPTLRDAIARAIAADDGRTRPDTWNEQNADAVLAMPEMQAIKRALRACAEDARYQYGGLTPPDVFLSDPGFPPGGLPANVREWVTE